MNEWQIVLLIVTIILLVMFAPAVRAFLKHPREFIAYWRDKDPSLRATRLDRIGLDEIVVHTALGHVYRGAPGSWFLADPDTWEPSRIRAPAWARKRLDQIWDRDRERAWLAQEPPQ